MPIDATAKVIINTKSNPTLSGPDADLDDTINILNRVNIITIIPDILFNL